MEPTATAPSDSIVMLDIGKKRKKQIRNLRKGKGKITEQLHEAIADLKAEKALSADAQVVVVVVRERRKSKRMFGMF